MNETKPAIYDVSTWEDRVKMIESQSCFYLILLLNIRKAEVLISIYSNYEILLNYVLENSNKTPL